MNTIEKYKAVIALIAALLVMFLGERGGLTSEQVAQAVWVLIAYILGVKIESRAK